VAQTETFLASTRVVAALPEIAYLQPFLCAEKEEMASMVRFIMMSIAVICLLTSCAWLISQFVSCQLGVTSFVQSIFDGWYSQSLFTSTSTVFSGWWLKVARRLEDHRTS
jgi:hypothetical protein